MSAYFDALERELRTAVPRAAAAREGPRQRTWPAIARGLVPAVAVAVAVVVIVVALTIGGRIGHVHHGPSTHAAAPALPAAPAAPATGVPTLGELEANFAVLRRPQTAVDRSWRPPRGLVFPRPRPGLTREARRFGGQRVFVTVDPPHSSRGGPASSLMSIWLVPAHGNDDSSESFGPQVNYNALPLKSGGLLAPPRTNTWVELVPDGAASVRWTFTCGRRPGSGRSCPGHRLFTVTAPVRDNVAIKRVPDTGFCRGCAQPVTTLWFDARGAVIFQYAVADHTNLTRPPFTPPAGPPRLLDAGGVGGARFGMTPEAVIAALRAQLGLPSRSRFGAAQCGIDGALTWGAGTVKQFRALPMPLTLYFGGERLVGYSYGREGAPPNRSVVLLDPRSGRVVSRSLGLATARGLTLADSLSRGRMLYGPGPAFQTVSAQGGSWSVPVRGGRLAGFAYREPAHGDVGATLVVQTIAAGNTGCPAVAP